MRIFSALRRLLASGKTGEYRHEGAWLYDPFMHPDVQAMSERQLADLPFGRRSYRNSHG